MKFRTGRSLSLVAAAVASGLSGVSFASTFGVTGSVSVPLNSTDDTPQNNPVTYKNVLIQTIQDVTVPNGNFQGAGTPYVVGTLGFTIGTSSFSSSTETTAFYYNPTVGLHFFGQFNASTTAQYQNSAATTNFNGIINQPLYYHSAALFGENAAGQIIAYNGIEAPDSSTNDLLGRHAYQYSIATNTYVPLGLTSMTPGASGASYSYNLTYTNTSAAAVTATVASSTPGNIDGAGNVSGTSNRYYAFGGANQSSASSLGTSTWYYNASTGITTETGLTGIGYSFARTFSDGGTGYSSTNSDKGTKNGFSVGLATPLIDSGNGSSTTLGQQGWLYNGTTTIAVGLLQSGITPTVDGSALSYAYSYNVNANTTTGTVSGNNRTSNVMALNSAGQVGGTTTLYQAASGSTSKGQDSFIYTPATNSYRNVGLMSNGFSTAGTSSFVSTAGARNSTISYLNSNGASAGTSTQYVSSAPGGAGNTTSNSVTWYTPAVGPTIQIGLTDTYHTSVSTSLGYSFTTGGISELTDSGFVAGTASRYVPGTATSTGSDPWVYDSNTGTTYDLDPSANSSSYFTGSITYLSESGVAVGQYKTINNSAAPFNAFEWSPTLGFVDLNSATSLTYSPFQTLLNGFSSDPTGTTLYSTAGTLNNGLATQTGFAILTTAVPEPASLSILVAGLGLTVRRSRRSRLSTHV